MTQKLTPRQQVQLEWLGQLPRKFERMNKIVELLATQHAEDSQLRGLTRMLDELKAQANGIGLTALGDAFGYMAMLLRRAGGHQVKVRGLREMLAGAKVNFEGALREASTPQPAPAAPGEGDVSP
jgi:hypothetical protein